MMASPYVECPSPCCSDLESTPKAILQPSVFLCYFTSSCLSIGSQIVSVRVPGPMGPKPHKCVGTFTRCSGPVCPVRVGEGMGGTGMGEVYCGGLVTQVVEKRILPTDKECGKDKSLFRSRGVARRILEATHRVSSSVFPAGWRIWKRSMQTLGRQLFSWLCFDKPTSLGL